MLTLDKYDWNSRELCVVIGKWGRNLLEIKVLSCIICKSFPLIPKYIYTYYSYIVVWGTYFSAYELFLFSHHWDLCQFIEGKFLSVKTKNGRFNITRFFASRSKEKSKFFKLFFWTTKLWHHFSFFLFSIKQFEKNIFSTIYN